MVIQIFVLISGIGLEGLGLLPKVHVRYLDWLATSRTLIALTLAFYLSRKALGVFDRFVDTRRFKSSDNQTIN